MEIKELNNEIEDIRNIISQVKKGLERNDATHVGIIRSVSKIKRDNESSFNDVRAHVLTHWRVSLIASAIGLLAIIYRIFVAMH
ncbi:MAG: hypothetical protein QM529_04840 [Hydrotalea sp.]|nr:hypothetical protein [Hydrotalea sp.]